MARRTPSENDRFFLPEQLTELREYVRPLRRARRARLILTTLVDLVVIFGFDLPARIADGAGSLAWPLQLLLIATVLDLVTTVIGAPFNWWANLVYEKRSGQSTMTPAVWVKDLLTQFVIGLVLNVVLMVPLFAAIRAIDQWWIAGTVLIVAIQILFAFVYPVVVMPRFNKFTPMPEGEIRDRIEEIARMSDVQIQGVYLMDASKRTTRPNAGVTGFGKTKRVVINDTICDFPLEELSQVIAHELGHYRLMHVPKLFPMLALQFPFVLLFVDVVAGNSTILGWAGASRLGDPSSYGVFEMAFGLAMAVAGLPAAWLSRKHEREADLEALELLGDPTSFTRMWPRLVLSAKAELEPTWWARAKGTHPEIAERIQFGLDWAKMNGVPVTPPEPIAVPKPDVEPAPTAVG